MDYDGTPVELSSYPNEMQAQMAANLLQENGIGAYVCPTMPGGYSIRGVTPFAPHSVMVAHSNLQSAREIISEVGI